MVLSINSSILKTSVVFACAFIFTFSPLYAKKQEILFSPIFFNEGIRYYKAGDLQNSISSLNKSLALRPSDISSLLVLGQAYLKDGKPALAVKTFLITSKLYPTDPLVHFLLGTAYEQNKQLKESLGEYKIALNSEPENTLIRFALGKACFLSEDYKCAVDNLEKVILAYPLHLKSRLLLASSYHNLKKY
jgi:tetratricopeptide (TPR) repeat protein